MVYTKSMNKNMSVRDRDKTNKGWSERKERMRDYGRWARLRERSRKTG